MAAASLNNTARIKVENGVYTMYIYTKEMSFGSIKACLQELKVAGAGGNYRQAAIAGKDSAGNPNCFSFVLPNTNEYLDVKVNPHVEMMGNQDLDARLKIDYSRLTQISGNTNVTNIPASSGYGGTGVNGLSGGTGAAPKTGDTAEAALPALAMMLSLAAAAYGVRRKFFA